MNHEEEMAEQIERLLIENSELKGRAQVAEKQVEDAKRAVQTYIEEIQRTGKGVKDMLQNMVTIQAQADMVRRRLGKVQMALLAADNLVNAYRSEYPSAIALSDLVSRKEDEYTMSRKDLTTSDAQPDQSAGQQQPSGPDPQAPDHRR